MLIECDNNNYYGLIRYRKNDVQSDVDHQLKVLHFSMSLPSATALVGLLRQSFKKFEGLPENTVCATEVQYACTFAQHMEVKGNNSNNIVAEQ